MTRPVQHTAAAVAAWLREGRRVVAGLLVEVEGSSPLDVGASMYIDDQGGIEGSITGGCVEGAVASAAMDIIESDGPPQLVTYGISDELAGTVGLMCGGIVHIFIHELTGEAREAVLLDLEATIEHRPAALVTLLDGPMAGAKLYVDSSGSTGTLNSGELLDKNAEREARGLLAEGRSSLRDFGTDGASLGSGLRVYASIQAEPPRMIVFGAIDFSSALAPLAKGLGYRVTIADPRSAFLKSRRFSAAAETEVGWPDKVLDGVELGPARRGADLHARPEARRARGASRARHGRRVHRRARQPQDDRGPQPASARGRRDRGRDRPRVRALRAGHRRLHRGGDRRGGAGRDRRPPRRAPRTTVAGGRRADPPR